MIISCAQKGSEIIPIIFQSSAKNDYVKAYKNLDSLNKINPRFHLKDTNIAFIENYLNAALLAKVQVIQNRNDYFDTASIIDLCRLLDSISLTNQNTSSIKGGQLAYKDIVKELKNHYIVLIKNYMLSELTNIRDRLNSFKSDSNYADTSKLIDTKKNDSVSLFESRNNIMAYKDSMDLLVADSMIHNYFSLVPENYKKAKRAMMVHDQKVRNLKYLFIGTWSKYETTDNETYAVTGILTNDSYTYTIRANGTYLMTHNSNKNKGQAYSNYENDEEKGTWKFDESDTSITLTCEKSRSIGKTTVAADYGPISSNNGSSEWDDCSNTQQYTVVSFREDKYRKN
jgi:hypothetical protein